MEDTNEISQNLKQVVHDYYMEYIRGLFNSISFLVLDINEPITKISDSIIQLIDEKVQQKDSNIYITDIIEIVNNVVRESSDTGLSVAINARRMNDAFPKVASVKIKDGMTAHLREIREKILEPDEVTSSYLYLADEYYNAHIQEIEAQIKQLEKSFSSKDIEGFEEQFEKESAIKKYELDSAKEYENSRRQIDEKQKKFDAVKDRMVSDYGRKYHEIITSDKSDEEKQSLLKQLLSETKSYTEKTNAAAIQLEQELEELNDRFKNRAQNSNDIMQEMLKTHIFDRNKYIRDRKGEQNTQLARLYERRDELNTYRTEHNQPIYEVKQNPFTTIINAITRNIKGEKPQLLLENHPEREIPIGVNPIIAPHQEGIDENLIQTLAHLYGERAKFDISEQKQPIDTTEFEAHLVKYFRAHYKDLMEEGYNHFLSDFAEMPDDIQKWKKEGELAGIARQYGIDPQNFKCYGYTLSIRDGLIYEQEIALGKLEKVHYATDKGINSVIEDLYGKALYEDHTSTNSFSMEETRKLKNGFIEYAKQHGIKIDNEYALEKMQVNSDKVNAISKYLNELLNSKLAREEEGYKPVDYADVISQDITENYSTVMNLDSYSFSDLASVKDIAGDIFLNDAYLKINEDSIVRSEDYSPRIVYATPEYCAREYSNIMDKIHRLTSNTNPFIEGYFDLEKANAMKTALRTYIQENDINIDTSVEQVKPNKKRIDMIADALVKQYGEKVKNPKTFKSHVKKKLNINWSEIMTEMKVFDVGEMFKDELQEGTTILDQLYVNDDFIYLGDFDSYHAKCIYATPEALEANISKLNEIISTRDSLMAGRQINAKNALTKYAKDKHIKLNVPSLASVKSQQEQRKRMERGMFDSLFSDILPDDPTARKKLNLEDDIFTTFYKMSEGNPGAITAMTQLIKEDPTRFMLILSLDDMNIRGSQIWQVYKYYCEEDVEKFKKVIQDRDADMVQYLNEENASVGQEKAVSGGAFFDRSKKPDLYRFTEEDVDLYREAREERLQKAREEREQQKSQPKQKRYLIKRKNREDKIKAYRDALIQKGKDTIFKKQNKEDQDMSDDSEER